MKAFAAVSLTICMIGFFMKLFQIMFEEYLTWIEDEEERGYYGQNNRTGGKERRKEGLQNRFYKQPKRRKKALASKLPRRRR